MIEIKDRNSNCERFRDIFHFELKEVSELEVYQWKPFIALDIIKFEEKMKERGYNESKESLHKYIKENYWKGTDVFIRSLL